MGTLVIILFIIVLGVFSFNFFKKNSYSNYKKTLNDENGKVSDDVQAEPETEKLIRHLEERQDAEYNAELTTARDSAPTPKSANPIPHEKMTQDRDASQK